MFSAIRRVVHEMDPNIPVVDMRTLDVQIERNLVTERLIAFLAASLRCWRPCSRRSASTA